jgi:hypothetical protein
LVCFSNVEETGRRCFYVGKMNKERAK